MDDDDSHDLWWTEYIKTNLFSFLYCACSRCCCLRFSWKCIKTAFDVIEAFLKKHFETLPVGMGELPTTALTEPTHIICTSLTTAQNIALHTCVLYYWYTSEVHVPLDKGCTHQCTCLHSHSYITYISVICKKKKKKIVPHKKLTSNLKKVSVMGIKEIKL